MGLGLQSLENLTSGSLERAITSLEARVDGDLDVLSGRIGEVEEGLLTDLLEAILLDEEMVHIDDVAQVGESSAPRARSLALIDNGAAVVGSGEGDRGGLPSVVEEAVPPEKDPLDLKESSL